MNFNILDSSPTFSKQDSPSSCLRFLISLGFPSYFAQSLLLCGPVTTVSAATHPLGGLPSLVARQLQLRLHIPYFYPLCSALPALLCKRTVLSQKGLWPLAVQTPKGLPTICFPDWLAPVTLLAQSSLSPPVMVTLLSTRSHPCLHKMTLVSESLLASPI